MGEEWREIIGSNPQNEKWQMRSKRLLGKVIRGTEKQSMRSSVRKNI